MPRPWLLLAPLALALAVPGPASAATTVDVAIVNFSYDPLVAQVHAGDTVRWTNIDGAEHTVTLDLVFDSGTMWDGDTFSHTFDLPGVFPYRCVFHPLMVGAVVVQP